MKSMCLGGQPPAPNYAYQPYYPYTPSPPQGYPSLPPYDPRYPVGYSAKSIMQYMIGMRDAGHTMDDIVAMLRDAGILP